MALLLICAAIVFGLLVGNWLVRMLIIAALTFVIFVEFDPLQHDRGRLPRAYAPPAATLPVPQAARKAP